MTSQAVSPIGASSSLGVPEANAETVKRWLDAGEIVLVDVRETSEYDQEHIPGSVLCPLSVFDPDVFPKIPEKMVVFHCAIGKRSAAAVKQLLETGHSRVINLEGGLKAWKEAGGPTEIEFVAPEPPNKTKPAAKAEQPEGLAAQLPDAGKHRPQGTHPGTILMEEYIKPLGLTQAELAKEIKVSSSRINAIILGRGSVSADTALRLSRFLSTTEEFWLHLQAAHDLEKARQAAGKDIQKDVRVRKAAA